MSPNVSSICEVEKTPPISCFILTNILAEIRSFFNLGEARRSAAEPKAEPHILCYPQIKGLTGI